MKLSSDEGRALAFVLGLIGLAAVARLVTRPSPSALPPAAEVSADSLEQASDSALQRQRALERPLGPEERIDVNAAAAEDLDRLPGVGPALARRIVAERERGGAFDSAADLQAVPGVGAAALARLAAHLAFGPGAGLARRAPPAQTNGGNREDLPAAAARGSGTGPAAGERTGAPPRRRADARVAASPPVVDLNTATASDLEALPGIGPALARRIVAKRDSLHGFRTPDDLLAVRGIGPATLRRLKPYLRS